jgi:hypothetical protein
MGLLDDAIREHLELKRRRGGDPAEIERAERDALGPVRREPEPIVSGDYGEPEPDLEPAGEPFAQAPGEIPLEPEPPLAHGTVGTGPEAPGSPEPLEVAEEHDPWVSHPAGEQLDELAAHEAMPHEELEADPYDAAGHDPLPEPVSPPPAAVPPPVAPPPPGVPPARGAGADHLNQETAEYRLEPEPKHALEPGAEEAEDMLEETPEFLQDAPEHDRLWFEQRPPRDFDFDK